MRVYKGRWIGQFGQLEYLKHRRVFHDKINAYEFLNAVKELAA